VQYRITKDCGYWWEQTLEPGRFAWGVSESQKSRASKVAPGDILIHFLDGVHAWAGYSVVTGTSKPNDRDAESDWREALPHVIPIERRVWLNKNECFLTRSVPGLVGQNYHRQQSFTAIRPEEATLIIAAIDAAKGKDSPLTDEFNIRWNKDAEKYYWDIVRSLSGGKCWLCGETAESWIAKNNLLIPIDEVIKIRERFLDVAHIEARKDEGKLSPDNVRCLCPNCHRIVDRIPKETCKMLLKTPKLAALN
jgi:hypothetical protein